MPRDVQLQVFQRSFSTKGEPGRGLGTFSVKLLTGRYLRGSVHFTSSAEHGTVFTVTLPRQPSGVRTTLPAGGDGSATRLPPTPQAKPLLGRCLLLVDDLPENRRLIGYMLRAAGAEVVTADGGGAALAEAEAMRHTARMFDAILLDMDMPDIDGFEVARTLREQQEICPIVALTAFDDESDRQSCIAAGCTFHLSKPVERLTLIAAVQRICDDGSS
jgi:CheY-like chemotaxis protein